MRAARNRIEIFRDAVSGTDTDLVVVDSKVRNPNEDSRTRGESLQEDPAEIRVSVVNLDEPAEGVVEVAFYDDDGTVLRDTTAAIALDSDEEQTVTLDVVVPAEAVYHTTVARRTPRERAS